MMNDGWMACFFFLDDEGGGSGSGGSCCEIAREIEGQEVVCVLWDVVFFFFMGV